MSFAAFLMDDKLGNSQSTLGNRLLLRLPPNDFEIIRPHLEFLTLEPGYLLADYCDSLSHCFFPRNGLISLIALAAKGTTCEVGYIGREGMIGLPAIFGKNEMPYQAMIQVKTDGFSVKVDTISDLFHQHPQFRKHSLHFIYVLLRQFAQTSLCNHYHDIQSRLCRKLTILSERAGSLRLKVTQERLAYILGVQRSSIAVVAYGLQSDGLIAYKRGTVELTDPAKIRLYACECLAIIEAEIDSLLAN